MTVGAFAAWLCGRWLAARSLRTQHWAQSVYRALLSKDMSLSFTRRETPGSSITAKQWPFCLVPQGGYPMFSLVDATNTTPLDATT